ncbi:DUF2304 domain-containing protein [Roseimaritima ulvae]|uniref:DUF2304 domain-containing protein n=1 Tax=Roseimaritima ulvae TaxID=980254 RepID=A0A5B9QSZ9_9BACT|nr:DUF2304 domain-containing protein [Roseimaritima ulvae]QEG40860.1 hypothetical protein UC8_28780 [Roseimaritima ulvae]
MNLFQWFTVSALGLLALLEARAYLKNHQPIHILRECVWLAAVLMILFPGLTTRVADLLGIGRGTDLVFYAFMLLATGAFFHVYGRTYVMRRDIVELARREALRTATPGQGLPRPAQPAAIAPSNEGAER